MPVAASEPREEGAELTLAPSLEEARELASRVHLDVSVRVRRSWRADEGLLDRLGIE
jgi:hypothetical protein